MNKVNEEYRDQKNCIPEEHRSARTTEYCPRSYSIGGHSPVTSPPRHNENTSVAAFRAYRFLFLPLWAGS
jgi:hypothetical protein